jgi:hypothetical protein
MLYLFWHKGEGYLTNLSLCFQNPLHWIKSSFYDDNKFP